jgi:hypothetical protein
MSQSNNYNKLQCYLGGTKIVEIKSSLFLNTDFNYGKSGEFSVFFRARFHWYICCSSGEIIEKFVDKQENFKYLTRSCYVWLCHHYTEASRLCLTRLILTQR